MRAEAPPRAEARGAATAGRVFGLGVARVEDHVLLTGRARFVDDVEAPGCLHAAFVRSDFAHARIRGVDLEAARAAPGVVAAFAAADLGDYWQPGPLLVSPPPIERLEFHARTQVPLAKDKARHAGEPVAVIVADSRYAAEDAVELVYVDAEPLDAVVDLEAALAPGAPLVHDDLPSNLAARVVQSRGDYDAAVGGADRVIARRLAYDRGAAAAIENRGVLAEWDARAGELTVWDTTQAPIPIRNGLARMLGLSESKVRVVAPFIGGGFGPKIMMFYPEEVVIPWLAIALERPVKWIEDRRENFHATTQERLQIHDAEIALTADGRIVGVKDAFLHDTGAYDPYGLTVPINSQCTLLGPYDVPHYHSEMKVVFTNKTIVTPVRGAGRQHGVFVIERLLDLAARELGIDRVEIRRRNYLPPDSFPHDNNIIYQDFAPLVYDSGNYRPALEKAARIIGWDAFHADPAGRDAGPAERDADPAARDAGAAPDGGARRRRGIGIVSYVEGTGIGPYEGARVSIEPSGRVRLATGVGTQGQGHFTSFAQIVAEQLGVDADDVDTSTGDTREFHWGTGTFASRATVVAGSACHQAAEKVREKAIRLAAGILGVAPAAVELGGGAAYAREDPSRSIGLGELAARSNPLRGAVRPGEEPGLEATAYFGPDRGSTASGVHACVVEVDPETAEVEVVRYLVVHDCGTIVNPVIVDGQIHGGVAMGIGNALFEKLHYDESGQLLNASFMDYLLPTATDVPPIETAHIETPSPLNPLGVKGVGEAGAIPAAAAIAQAIEDALGIDGLEILEIPIPPDRLWALIRGAS